MELELTWPWLALLALGAFHGVNPGMGWLFAVALGLQERKRSAVWRSLGPLALGHALAVAVVLLATALVGHLVPLGALKWVVALSLFGLGFYHLVRHRHPRYGGMRVGARDLTVWSFLMASAHGAGLMVLPFVFGTNVLGSHDPTAMDHAHHVSVAASSAVPAGHAGHASVLAGLPAEPVVGFLVAVVHTLGYLLVMGLVAVVVYEKLGLRLLRTHWFNLDLVWAGALLLTASLTLLL